MRKRTVVWGGLWAVLSSTTAWAAEPLPLSITPVSGTEVIAGRSFTLRVDTDAPIETMKVKVSARWQPTEKRGAPPLEFDIVVPWDQTGFQPPSCVRKAWMGAAA